MATPTPRPTPHPLEGIGPIAADGEIELRNSAFLRLNHQHLGLLAAVLLPLLLLVGIAVWVLVVAENLDPTADSGELAEMLGQALWDSLTQDPLQLIGVLLGSVGTAIAGMRVTRARLYVGPAGLRYFSGMPSWLGPVARNWSLSIDAIRDVSVAYRGIQETRALSLTIETDDKPRRLGLFDWANPATYDAEAWKVLEQMRPDPEAITRLFESLPLVRFAHELGFAIEMPDKTEAFSLDLRKLPRTTTAILIALVAFAYAAIDMGVVSETYSSGAPIGMLVLGGVSLGALSWWGIGSRETTPWIRGSVAALVGATTLAALYPGLIRLNRIGAPEPQAYLYRHTQEDRLEPASRESPRIDLPDLVSLLDGSQPGDLHELWIRHGSLGFDQLDIDALDAWIEGLAAEQGERGDEEDEQA